MFEVSEWICEYTGCNKYFENPIVLPCGNSICSIHIGNNTKSTKFLCNLCKEYHVVPKTGYKVNKALIKAINLDLHLNEKQKKAKKLFEEIETIADDYVKNGLIMPDNFIFEHFSIIRSKIILHKEKLIGEINKSSEECLNKLNLYEKECLNKKSVVKKIDLNLLVNETIHKWKQHLKNPKITDLYLESITLEMTNNMQNIKDKILDYKKSLINDFDYCFEPTEHDDIFGKLVENNSSLFRPFKCLYGLNYFHESTIFCASYINNYLITGAADFKIKIWDLKNGKCLTTLNDHQNCVISITPLSKSIFLSGSWDYTIKLWNMNECLDTYKYFEKSDIVVKLVAINQTSFICSFSTGFLKIFNIVSNKITLQKELNLHSKGIKHLLFDRKLNIFVSNWKNKIKIWNIVNYENTSSFNVKGSLVTDMEIVKSKKYNDSILSSTLEGFIEITQIKNGIPLITIDRRDDLLSVRMISSNLIAFASKRDGVKIYDIEKKLVKQSLNNTDSITRGLEFIEEKKLLVTYGSNGTLKIWHF